MTQAFADRDARLARSTLRPEIPAFKPVALPALAAAVRAARQEDRQTKARDQERDIPAILRAGYDRD